VVKDKPHNSIANFTPHKPTKRNLLHTKLHATGHPQKRLREILYLVHFSMCPQVFHHAKATKIDREGEIEGERGREREERESYFKSMSSLTKYV
jgi:hypothetical protein